MRDVIYKYIFDYLNLNTGLHTNSIHKFANNVCDKIVIEKINIIMKDLTERELIAIESVINKERIKNERILLNLIKGTESFENQKKEIEFVTEICNKLRA
tara:strand:- start:186 stop:485 length:300 start_codon:yes stop_codon:yes gene_type:complete